MAEKTNNRDRAEKITATWGRRITGFPALNAAAYWLLETLVMQALQNAERRGAARMKKQMAAVTWSTQI